MRLLRHLLHLLHLPPRTNKFLGSLASWLCGWLAEAGKPASAGFFHG
jgi:hypothetical protein